MLGSGYIQSSFSGLGAVNAPASGAAQAYYAAGTPFMWLAPSADFGFALAIDPGSNARNTLANVLAGQGYRVNVVYGARGGPLEVSGSQNIDRGSATHIRDQITQAAEQAGFILRDPIQFNVQSSGSSWQVGQPGSQNTWGDKTPVPVKSIFSELGIDIAGDLTGDHSFLGNTVKNALIFGGIGLVLFAVLSKK